MQLSAWFKVNLSWGQALFRCDSWSHGGSQLFAGIECSALFLPQIIMFVEDTKFSGIEESLKIWVGAVIGLKPPSSLCCLSAGGFDLIVLGGVHQKKERSFADFEPCFYSRFCCQEGFPVLFKHCMPWNRNADPKVKRLRFIGFSCIGINKKLLLSMAGFVLVIQKGDLASPSLLPFMPVLWVSFQLYYPYMSVLPGLSHQAIGNKFMGPELRLNFPCPSDRTNVWLWCR